jgi:hypothetical protein
MMHDPCQARVAPLGQHAALFAPRSNSIYDRSYACRQITGDALLELDLPCTNDFPARRDWRRKG